VHLQRILIVLAIVTAVGFVAESSFVAQVLARIGDCSLGNFTVRVPGGSNVCLPGPVPILPSP
jgi:hypothetical protein